MTEITVPRLEPATTETSITRDRPREQPGRGKHTPENLKPGSPQPAPADEAETGGPPVDLPAVHQLDRLA